MFYGLLAKYPFNFERKNGFRWQFWIFAIKTGSRFLELFFYKSLPSIFKICHCIFNISQLVRKLSAKNRFRWPFWICATKPEVEFSNLYLLLITTIDLENMPLEFWKYLNKFSGYQRKTGLRWPFWIFATKPEVKFSNL